MMLKLRISEVSVTVWFGGIVQVCGFEGADATLERARCEAMLARASCVPSRRAAVVRMRRSELRSSGEQVPEAPVSADLAAHEVNLPCLGCRLPSCQYPYRAAVGCIPQPSPARPNQETAMHKVLYPMLCALLGLTLARPAAPQ